MSEWRPWDKAGLTLHALISCAATLLLCWPLSTPWAPRGIPNPALRARCLVHKSVSGAGSVLLACQGQAGTGRQSTSPEGEGADTELERLGESRQWGPRFGAGWAPTDGAQSGHAIPSLSGAGAVTVAGLRLSPSRGG